MKYKDEFVTTLTEKTTNISFQATVKVRMDGWGDVYGEDGIQYAGGLNPMRVRSERLNAALK